MAKPISLMSQAMGGATVIPNLFFDEYLPRANGEFLKIYLYLYRWLSASNAFIDVEQVADSMGMTEKDVCRAVRYWESEGLLSLICNAQGEITGICLNNLFALAGAAQNQPGPASSFASSESASDFVSGKETISQSTSAVGSAAAPAARKEAGAVRSYSMAEIASMAESDEGEELIQVIQFYLGHMLSATDLNLIYYFHEDLGFSYELLEYLFEHCANTGHRNMKYIQAVALAWHDKGITSKEDAKHQTENYQKECYAVLKAFGISGRRPAEGEAAYVRKWTEDYGFTLEMVLEACNRTMMAIHTPSFEYTDSILTGWQKHAAFSLAEVAALDQQHSAGKAQKAVRTHVSARQTRQPANKFHNFNQRSYAAGELEQAMLRKLSGSGHTGS